MKMLKLIKIHKILERGAQFHYLVAIEEVFPFAFALIGSPGIAFLFHFKTNNFPYCFVPFDSSEFSFNFPAS